MSTSEPLFEIGVLCRIGLLVLGCAMAAALLWVFRLWLFGAVLPESTVSIVNNGPSVVVGGEIEIGRTVHEVGTLRPGERQDFGYRWRGGEGDFGLKVQLQTGRELEERVGYIDSTFYVGGNSDEIFVQDNKICMKVDYSRMSADLAAQIRSSPHSC